MGGVRWLLLKDLRILRRSPLLVALLVAYPVVMALLVGLALSRGPEKPRVAFVNEVATGQGGLTVGGQRIDPSRYVDELLRSVDPVPARDRADALAKVRSGEALGAVIVPADTLQRLQSAINLSGSQPPTIEVAYSLKDPLNARLVESTIKARLADANRALSRELTQLTARYLGILLRGGEFSLLGQDFDVIGLQRSKVMLEEALRTLPAGSPEADEIRRVADFAQLAIDNLALSDNVLSTVGEPLRLKRTVLDGRRTPLDAFAVAVAVALASLLVTVLLAAGMVALEREEGVLGRLVRGLVSPSGLLAEKLLLSVVCGVPTALAMLAGIGLLVDVDWGRLPWWPVAVAAACLGFGALGVAIGTVAREVRAASLLAILLALPMTFLALVPEGSVAGGLDDAARAISALMPFRPALQAIDAAVNDASPGIAVPLAHLLALTAAYLAVARVALRRPG